MKADRKADHHHPLVIAAAIHTPKRSSFSPPLLYKSRILKTSNISNPYSQKGPALVLLYSTNPEFSKQEPV